MHHSLRPNRARSHLSTRAWPSPSSSGCEQLDDSQRAAVRRHLGPSRCGGPNARALVPNAWRHGVNHRVEPDLELVVAGRPVSLTGCDVTSRSAPEASYPRFRRQSWGRAQGSCTEARMNLGSFGRIEDSMLSRDVQRAGRNVRLCRCATPRRLRSITPRRVFCQFSLDWDRLRCTLPSG